MSDDAWVIQEYKFALEELSQLQNIIGRQDELKSKCKRLIVTLFSAFTFAFLSNKLSGINYADYLLSSFIIILSFLIIESVYGVTELNAEKRVKHIEEFLRGEIDYYDGPAICKSLQKEGSSVSNWDAMKRPRTFMLYLVLAVITIFIAFLNYDQTNENVNYTDKTSNIVCHLDKLHNNAIKVTCYTRRFWYGV